MLGWDVPVVARDREGAIAGLEAAPVPNQGGEGAAEAAAQFRAARDAALSILRGGHLGADGVFTVRLSGRAQPGHSADAAVDLPAEVVTIEIARHAPAESVTYEAGPVRVTLASGPTDPAQSAPLEALSLEVARHVPRIGRRSY